MGNILIFPPRNTVDPSQSAWDEYQALGRAAIDDPRLLLDRDHCEAMSLAWDRWRSLFLKRGAK